MALNHSPPLTPAPRLSLAQVRRLVWLPLWLAAGVLLVILLGMLLFSWRGLHQLEPIQTHLEQVEQLQDIGLSTEQSLLKALRGEAMSSADWQALRSQIQQLSKDSGDLHPDSVAQLTGILARLDGSQPNPVDLLFETLSSTRRVLDGERKRHDALLAEISAKAHTEFQLTALSLLLGLVLIAATLILLRRRVKQPLRVLEELLTCLAQKDYRPVPESLIGDIDPLAQPAFARYNQLVTRLQQLEANHRDREQSLEHEVRHATEALLAQSRELARAERLAAVGAVSAGLAHELRNPLAGIQMACRKLQQALEQTEHAPRISAVNDELKRINRLLDSQLDAASHVPEPLESVAVDVMIGELLTLLRYQIPATIQIVAQVPEHLRCPLPAAGLRQALLNLMLNAVQAVPADGQLLITAQTDDAALEIRVADNGPGFPGELLRAGIRPFATGRQGGTGLGLAMVRRFVRDHDGDLELANQSPNGAVVILRLPCRLHPAT